jgi:hypothetical protein
VIIAIGIELAKSKVLGNPETLINTAQSAALQEVTNIVHARAEAVAPQRERMGPAAGPVVLFEYDDLFARLRQCDRSGQPASTRADDDYIGIQASSLYR